VPATPTFDRFTHHSETITIRGDSYRLREKRIAGLLTSIQAKTSGQNERSREFHCGESGEFLKSALTNPIPNLAGA
jgi:hypothetical protein